MSDWGDVTNADIAIFEYDKEGVVIQDSWSDDTGLIHRDYDQNYFLDKYEVNDNMITINFWRYFDTLDSYDYQLDNGTTHLIYLLPEGQEDTLQHPHRVNARDMESGFMYVQLLKPDLPDSYFHNNNDGEISSFSILQPNVTIPAQKTTYWSSISKMPDSIKDKVHVIRFGPDLSKESDGLIHHMLIYTCDPKDGDIPMYSGPSNSPDVPDKVSRCNRLVGGWAMGMEATSYPKVAGLPLGGNDKSRYFRLQVHYNNPTMRSGVQDSSGIRFYYINNLRKYDIGILEIGVSMDAKMAIPPRQKELALSGTCPKQCTSEGVPTEGINVIASHLHTHLAGRKVWISHFRDGVQLPEVNRDNHYSTFFEETRQIFPSVKIMPGDSLKTHCAYETLNREEVTVTGLAITDEMCISYLHYYPAATLELCDSTISRNALSEFIVLENLLKGRPKEVDFHDFIENYKNMQWDNGTIDELKYLYKTARLDVECRRSSGSLFEGNFSDVDVS